MEETNEQNTSRYGEGYKIQQARRQSNASTDNNPSARSSKRKVKKEMREDEKMRKSLVHNRDPFENSERVNSANRNFTSFQYVFDYNVTQKKSSEISSNPHQSYHIARSPKPSSSSKFTNLREGISELYKKFQWNSTASCSKGSKASLISASSHVRRSEQKQPKDNCSSIFNHRDAKEEQYRKRRPRSSRTRSVERKQLSRYSTDQFDGGEHTGLRASRDPKDVAKSSYNGKYFENLETILPDELIDGEQNLVQVSSSGLLHLIGTGRLSEGEIVRSSNVSEGEVTGRNIQDQGTLTDLTPPLVVNKKSAQINTDGYLLEKLPSGPKVDREAKSKSRKCHHHHKPHRDRRRSKGERVKHRKSSVTGKRLRRKRSLAEAKRSTKSLEDQRGDTNFPRPGTDFLNQPQRTPAQVLEQVLGIPPPHGSTPTRRTVIPMPPPLIGLETETETPKILPLLASEMVSASRVGRTKARVQSTARSMLGALRKVLVREGRTLEMTSTRKSFWLKQVLEQNRAKNKAANRTFALTFNWGWRRKRMRLSNRSILETFLRTLKLTKGRPNEEYITTEDDDGLYPWYYIGQSPAYPYEQNLSGYLNQLRPTSALTSLDPNQDPLIAKALELSQIPESLRAHRSHIVELDSGDPVNAIASRSRRVNRPFQGYTVNAILETSSKVSQKTEALLQASAAGSAGLLVPLPSPASVPPKAPLLNDNALLKLYTPKTEFTRQFASLLPSHRGGDAF